MINAKTTPYITPVISGSKLKPWDCSNFTNIYNCHLLKYLKLTRILIKTIITLS